MTYKILTGESTSELEEKVQEYLEKGYQMVGGISITARYLESIHKTYEILFSQAVVKP